MNKGVGSNPTGATKEIMTDLSSPESGAFIDICATCSAYWPSEIKTIGQLFPITCWVCKREEQKGAGKVHYDSVLAYKTLLHQLDEEMKAGRDLGGDDKAEYLRERMTAIWYEMTTEQCAELDRYSEELYQRWMII